MGTSGMVDLPSTPRTGDERATLLGFLTYVRAVAIALVEGLDAEQASRIAAPPLTSLLGIVKHLTNVERWWFQHVWAGLPELAFDFSDDDPDGDWRLAPGDSLSSIINAYRRIATENNDLLKADLGALSANTAPDGIPVSLRWVGWHVVEETSRHNGHADLIRQNIDGLAGLW